MHSSAYSAKPRETEEERQQAEGLKNAVTCFLTSTAVTTASHSLSPTNTFAFGQAPTFFGAPGI